MAATDKARIEQLEYDLEMAKADFRAAEDVARLKDEEIDELKHRVQFLEEEAEISSPNPREDDDEYVHAELLSDVRRLVHRKQYEDAIELADRELPSRYRYAC